MCFVCLSDIWSPFVAQVFFKQKSFMSEASGSTPTVQIQQGNAFNTQIIIKSGFLPPGLVSEVGHHSASTQVCIQPCRCYMFMNQQCPGLFLGVVEGSFLLIQFENIYFYARKFLPVYYFSYSVGGEISANLELHLIVGN